MNYMPSSLSLEGPIPPPRRNATAKTTHAKWHPFISTGMRNLDIAFKRITVMRIYVCIKHVPDTAANVKITGKDSFDDAACKFVINPYDEYGLEEAVQLYEQNKEGEVVAVTVGKEDAMASLRGAMAQGAHRGIHVKIDAQFLDSALTAQALKAAILQDGTPDIIFTGKGSVDAEGFQTQYRLAAALDMAIVNEVVDFKIDNGRATVQKEIGGGAREVLEMQLPCVIGATKGLNEPRYPKFPDIMKAKK